MRCVAYRLSVGGSRLLNHAQVHHILAEIIQGGVVLETNLDEIDSSSKSSQPQFKELLFPQADHVFAPLSSVVSDHQSRCY
jgi:hypothetical protein